MTKQEPLRIGMIMGKWVGGGVEAAIMNYYRHINREKIQFDFICDEDSTNIPYKEIEDLGGRVIICPPYQRVLSYIRQLKRIFKENKYKIVHSNINTLSVFPLYSAKKAGVQIRIAHSHSTSNKKEFKRNIIKNVLRLFSKTFANYYFACSENAAIYQFGTKTFENGEVTIVNNAIDIEEFRFNEIKRKQMRESIGINDKTIVIGHIGRFVTTKNHDFLIDLFKELHNQNENYVLMLLGQGSLEQQIRTKVKQLGLEKYVMFIGQKNNVCDYYQAMDVFVFPSLYEGLGLALIEAQCSGLPCISSSEVPDIVKISKNIKMLNLDDPINCWIDQIKEYSNLGREKDLEQIKNSRFDIESEVKKLEKKYLSF